MRSQLQSHSNYHSTDISVYQMILGSIPLFRRIDTDFVNVSPIIAHLSIALPPPSPNAVLVNQGSAMVCGTWVPLASAQAFVREHPLPDNLLETFLSDALFECFPSALQDFHQSNAPGRLLNQFGPHFKSTIEAKRRSRSMARNDVEFGCASEPWETDPVSDWDADNLLSGHLPFSLGLAGLKRPPEEELVPETPLSPTEQEMFYALCSLPDWEKENPSPSALSSEVSALKDAEEDAEDDSTPARVRDQPRRRSKRVANANAIATRTRTRSQKPGSRNSLP
jgi:hypothetical protein